MVQIVDRIETEEIVKLIAKNLSHEIPVLSNEISLNSTLRQNAQNFYHAAIAYDRIGEILSEISHRYNLSIPSIDVERITLMKPNELANYVNARIST